jgi:predicted metal-dependent phosphoesterase TrpH
VFTVDTHIHTCLSPCAELDMHPSAIVEAAVRAGLDVIAVCDHNSAETAGAVQRAGQAAGLTVVATSTARPSAPGATGRSRRASTCSRA